jgi:hypothetical protein
MPDIFEFHTPGEEPLGLVGPWQPGPAAPLSFGVGSELPPDIPVWRINLPEDEAEAEAALSGAEAQLAATEAELEQVPGRLDQLSHAFISQSGGISFDVSSSSVEPGSAEAAALSLLAEARAIEQGKPVSYGLGELGSQAWEQARAQFETFAGQLQREVLNLAWVETAIGSQLVARTIVGWSGDNNTAWSEDTSPQQQEQHRRDLDLAIMTRLQRVRLFVKVTGGAARLSVLFASGAGTLLALPVAWKYVQEVLQEVKNYQKLVHGG